MIRYALGCENGHEFESWFPSASSYDEQAARGLVECPACGSVNVVKQIMAPSLGKGASKEAAGRASEVPPAARESDASGEASAPQPVAILSEREQAMRAMMRAIREHVTKTAEHVGPRFADEARRMHYGEIAHRSIYGEANALDVQGLRDEGIEFHPLPIVPDDRN